MSSNNAKSRESSHNLNQPTKTQGQGCVGTPSDSQFRDGMSKRCNISFNGHHRHPRGDSPLQGALEVTLEPNTNELSFRRQSQYFGDFEDAEDSQNQAKNQAGPGELPLNNLKVLGGDSPGLHPWCSSEQPRGTPQLGPAAISNPFYACKKSRLLTVALGPCADSQQGRPTRPKAVAKLKKRSSPEKFALEDPQFQLGLQKRDQNSLIGFNEAELSSKRTKPSEPRLAQPPVANFINPLSSPPSRQPEMRKDIVLPAPAAPAHPQISPEGPFEMKCDPSLQNRRFCDPPNLPYESPPRVIPDNRPSPASIPPSNYASHVLQTPERSSKRRCNGGKSVQRITNERYSDDEWRSSHKMMAALEREYFKEEGPDLGSSRTGNLHLFPIRCQPPSLPPHPTWSNPRLPIRVVRQENGDNLSAPVSVPSVDGSPMPNFQNPQLLKSCLTQRPATAKMPTITFRERSHSCYLSESAVSVDRNLESIAHKQTSPVDEAQPSLAVRTLDFERHFAPLREQLIHIDNGDYGTVYKFQNICDHEEYVLKVISAPEAGVRESRLMSYIRSACPSRHIVGYHFGWVEGEAVNMILERCTGNADQHFRQRRGPVDRQALLSVLLHCAKALKTLHRARVVHLDLKPTNILVGRDGLFKLCDFGHARRTDSREDIKNIEEGDFAYTPPEFSGDVSPEDVASGVVDLTKVDIFSLGLSLLELFFIQSGSELNKEAKEKIREGDRESLRDVKTTAPFLEHLLRLMLSAHPRDRPSAEAIVSKIKEFELGRLPSFPYFNSIVFP